MRSPSAQKLASPFKDSLLKIAPLILCYFFVCIFSLLFSLRNAEHRIAYDPQHLPIAIAWAAALSLIAAVFLAKRFMFGYFVSFYFYTIVLGFVFLSWFTSFDYDRQTARISAVASLVAFVFPVAFLSAALPRPIISAGGFERLLNVLLFACAATVAVGALYNFRVVGLGSIYDYRSALKFPVVIGYLIGITSSCVLPFLFAAYAMQHRVRHALLIIALSTLVYPVTLTKTAFFTPVWLLWLLILLRFVEARVAVILSLLLPLLSGVALLWIFPDYASGYFEVVNFRMVTTPSSVLNVYNDFFAHHELTRFCQITLLNKLMNCPDSPALGAILQNTYGIGFLNGSLFATEGIASVGPLLAPLIAFLCGLVLAAGNCASQGLPPRFIVLSSGVLVHYLLNVPLTTALSTHGAALLFLLWYLTPRETLGLTESSRG